VTIAGVASTGQRFAEITGTTGANNPFKYAACDGILGMSYSSLSDSMSTTVFENMIAQKSVTSPMFSIYLTWGVDPEESGHEGSALVLGRPDSTYYYGNITYTNVTAAYYWQFNIEEVSYQLPGGRSNSVSLCKNSVAIADTGTSLLFGPTNVVNQLYADVGAISTGAMSYVSCSDVLKFPTLTFTINKTPFTLNGTEYTIFPSGNYNIGRCYIGIVKYGEGQDSWILGDTFLAKFYSVYDMGQNKIGFAKAKPWNEVQSGNQQGQKK